MPTTVNKTVKASGGDYTSLSAWEAAQGGNLVAADEIRQATCFGFTDTTPCTIGGNTVDATRYMKVVTDTAGGHVGKWDAAKYNLATTTASLTITDSYCRVEGIQVQLTRTGGAVMAVTWSASAAGDCRVERVIAKGVLSGTAASCIGFYVSTLQPGFRVSNCIAQDWSGGGANNSGFSHASTSQACYWYNCTAYNCAIGFKGAGNRRAKNCLAAACTDGFDTTAAFHASSNYNASDLASDAPGANSRNSQTFSFVSTAGTYDLHLTGSDAGARDFGTSLAADADYAITLDIDCQTRSGSWDIGADEYQSSITYLDTQLVGVIDLTGIGQPQAVRNAAGTGTVDLVGTGTPQRVGNMALEPVLDVSSTGAPIKVGNVSAAASVDVNATAQAFRVAIIQGLASLDVMGVAAPVKVLNIGSLTALVEVVAVASPELGVVTVARDIVTGQVWVFSRVAHAPESMQAMPRVVPDVHAIGEQVPSWPGMPLAEA